MFQTINLFMIEQKGMHLNQTFVVGIQCHTENEYTGHQHNIFI